MADCGVDEPAALHPRRRIEDAIRQSDLAGLLERAAEIHGHYCPGLAAGVKAAFEGCRRLDLADSDGMEEVTAIVECNSCFVDGIQAVSGCTLGNNALVYKDMGKTAVTFYRRGDARGLRLALSNVSPGTGLKERDREEATHLFDKAVKRREELSDEEGARFRALWTQSAYALLDQPVERLFAIAEVKVAETAYAPIVESAHCAKCGEKLMESRARLRDGHPTCLSCGEDAVWQVDGSGIRMAP